MESFRISIHALRVEGDRSRSKVSRTACRFLSTPSGWRATKKQTYTPDKIKISIHALRVEGDVRNQRGHQRERRDFYPRPPGGGRLRFSAPS